MVNRLAFMQKIFRSEKIKLTSPYGYQAWRGRVHKGEDWDCWLSQYPNLYAPINVVITKVRTTLSDDRGRYVEMYLGGGWYCLIQHMHSVSVVAGQRVKAGTKIGVEGGSGKTLNQYGTHVHIEFSKRKMGDPLRVAVNPPEKFYPVFNWPVYATVTPIVKNLRIRAGMGTENKFLSYALIKPYVIYEKGTEDGYVWGRLDWVADKWMALQEVDGNPKFVK